MPCIAADSTHTLSYVHPIHPPRLVWLDVTWVYALVHIWLLYYYISLALRENILRVNGSNIRPWWIYHHYLSAVMVIIILTWPNTHNYNHEFLPQFNVYCFCQGVVQLMQAQYQKKRLYIRKSLGKVTSKIGSDGVEGGSRTSWLKQWRGCCPSITGQAHGCEPN